MARRVRVYPFGVVDGFRIAAEPLPPPAEPAEAADAWARLCGANDRLFDGPIYAVRAVESAPPRLVVTMDSYRRLAIQADPAVGDLGVRLLGVKARIIGVDADGHEHMLIGRRHPQTRTYGGLWEVGPGGGVGPRDIAAERLDAGSLLAHLRAEAREELGLDLDASTAPEQPWPLVLEDDFAHSVDVVFQRRWAGVVNPRAAACRADDRDWEYIDTAWLSRREAPEFVRGHPDAISPAMLALLTHAGWVRP